MQEFIKIRGAKVHNLKNVNLDIPKNKLVVMTGVSGSGKSSLAFDTLYAEGQRRYVESLSSYARQFLGLMEKPDVESITGLSPAISIDQKTSGSNPRSTVGTITEIHDYLRLLYSHVGQPHCPNCNIPVNAQTIPEIKKQISEAIEAKQASKFQILSPLVTNRKGAFADLLDDLLSKGFLRIRLDDKVMTIEDAIDMDIDKNKKHTLDLIVDRLSVPTTKEPEQLQQFDKRLTDAIELATTNSQGEVKVLFDDDTELFYSENATCPNCKLSFGKLTPASFSFNSPHGACENCSGLGAIKQVEVSEIYNPKLTIREGGIFPWSNKTTKSSWTSKVLEEVASTHNFDLKTKIQDYPKEIFDLIFYGIGAHDSYLISYTNKQGHTKQYDATFEGVVPRLERRYLETDSEYIRKKIDQYMIDKACPACEGKKLKAYSLAVTIKGHNINDISTVPVEEAEKLTDEFASEVTGNIAEISNPILKEIKSRLKFLSDVGLNYLSLDRKANTLSGGESQRIRLASQIGTGLTGVLYVLDEPSIGLHSRDVDRLIGTLENLRDIGNSVVVVEHDFDTIKHADYLVDVGPYAGELGGKIANQGDLEKFLSNESLTSDYLNGKKQIGSDIAADPETYQPKDGDYGEIKITGARINNLKDVSADFPLGKMICVTGVSGSGKSSLVNSTLYPILVNEKMNGKQIPGPYDSIEGLENVDKVIGIDQSPIGRTPRSNPATYIGMFDYIRDLFTNTQEARARGYKKGRFSFNVKGGRCEKCRGEGQIKIEMQFLPDVYVKCDQCDGKRYNKEALQIDYKNKNIAEILDMTVTEAQPFFGAIDPIKRRLDVLEDVGLGYIKLGQYATTLSGGESQRIKLARELSKSTRGHTVYIMDEPTTGLHFHDIDKLLKVMKKLVAQGNTLIVIEHNMDVIRHADWIIDMGPEGGQNGGKLIAKGTPADLCEAKNSHTGQFLKKYLEESGLGAN